MKPISPFHGPFERAIWSDLGDVKRTWNQGKHRGITESTFLHKVPFPVIEYFKKA